jgi:hypothetical protein
VCGPIHVTPLHVHGGRAKGRGGPKPGGTRRPCLHTSPSPCLCAHAPPETPQIVQRQTVTVSPSPQLKNATEDKLVALRKYARDFRRQHMTDTEYVSDNSDDEDHNLAIGRLVVT